MDLMWIANKYEIEFMRKNILTKLNFQVNRNRTFIKCIDDDAKIQYRCEHFGSYSSALFSVQDVDSISRKIEICWRCHVFTVNYCRVSIYGEYNITYTRVLKLNSKITGADTNGTSTQYALEWNFTMSVKWRMLQRELA